MSLTAVEMRRLEGRLASRGERGAMSRRWAPTSITPRLEGEQSSLSGFFTGTTAADPATGQPRSLNDLGRCNADLRAIACPDPQASAGVPSSRLRKGIQRVHGSGAARLSAMRSL